MPEHQRVTKESENALVTVNTSKNAKGENGSLSRIATMAFAPIRPAAKAAGMNRAVQVRPSSVFIKTGFKVIAVISSVEVLDV